MCYRGYDDDNKYTYYRPQTPPRRQSPPRASTNNWGNSHSTNYISQQECSQGELWRERQEREYKAASAEHARKLVEEQQREKERKLEFAADRFYQYLLAFRENSLSSLVKTIDQKQFEEDSKWIEDQYLTACLRRRIQLTVALMPDLEKNLKLISKSIHWYFHLKNNLVNILNLTNKSVYQYLHFISDSQVLDLINEFLNFPECNQQKTFQTLVFEDGYKITSDQLAGLLRHIQHIRIDCSQVSDELTQLICQAKQKAGIDSNLKSITLKSGSKATVLQLKQLFALLPDAIVAIEKNGDTYACAQASGTKVGGEFKFCGNRPVSSQEANDLLSLTRTSVNELSIQGGGYTAELSIQSPERVTTFAVTQQRFFPSTVESGFARLLDGFYNLQALKFEDIVFQTPMVKKAFLDTISKNTKLDRLVLDNCEIDDKDVDDFLIPYLEANKKLICISLRRNNISTGAIQRLAEYMRDHYLYLIAVDIFQFSEKSVPLLGKVLERNRQQTNLAKDVEIVNRICNKYPNFNEIFTIEILEEATHDLEDALVKSKRLSEYLYPTSAESASLQSQVIERQKQLFFALLNAVVMQASDENKLRCHNKAIEVLSKLDLPAAELAQLYLAYEAQCLPAISEITTQYHHIEIEIEKLLSAIQKFLTTGDHRSINKNISDRQSQLFLVWLNIIDRAENASIRFSGHRKAIVLLNRLELPKEKLADLYAQYERRCLPGIANIAAGRVDEVKRLFAIITHFLTKVVDKNTHFVTLARAFINDDILLQLCDSAESYLCGEVSIDLVKIYISQVRPTLDKLDEIISRVLDRGPTSVKSDQIVDHVLDRFFYRSDEKTEAYTFWIYTLLNAREVDAKQAFKNCGEAIEVARNKKLNEGCLSDCYVAYAEALQKILALEAVDVSHLDVAVWNKLFSYLINPSTLINIYRTARICTALLKFCQTHIDKKLKRDSELEKSFIKFLCDCVRKLPSELKTIETCLTNIYKDKILNLINGVRDDAEEFLRKNLDVSNRLAEVLGQLNTYFNKRGPLNIYLATRSNNSLASRLDVVRTELTPLVSLFKPPSVASTAQLNLAGAQPVLPEANPPPSYAEPVQQVITTTAVRVAPPAHANREHPSEKIDEIEVKAAEAPPTVQLNLAGAQLALPGATPPPSYADPGVGQQVVTVPAAAKAAPPPTYDNTAHPPEIDEAEAKPAPAAAVVALQTKQKPQPPKAAALAKSMPILKKAPAPWPAIPQHDEVDDWFESQDLSGQSSGVQAKPAAREKERPIP